ncbi:MAG: hypothetical protein K1X67_16085 [Fimbriimonadaceae bacterium]|nr:hypothetical protein [Fimbriimonadaceae bacterium]
MTQSACWIEFNSDRSLKRKVEEGWFTDDKGGDTLPIRSLPAAPNSHYWTGVLTQWCSSAGVKLVRRNEFAVVARVKKAQIEDFIRFVYDGSPMYSDPKSMLMWKGRAYLANHLINLRAFVAQELNPRLWYELVADEY